jgi:predicted porin
VGLRYDIGAVELSTGYRYANMTDDMHDFKAGAAYKLTQNLALTPTTPIATGICKKAPSPAWV